MSDLKGIYAVSYNVTNWEQAKKFYGETLGLPLHMEAVDFGWMEFGRENETRLAIYLWRGPDPLPSSQGGGTAIFSVEDAYKTVEDLRRKGVKCDDVMAIPGMVTVANVYDPEGNMLNVAGPPPQA
ncbi:MAG: VOC family protein [Chloroflexi bacterium]|nr:VOC family protein [Chloroflexota bacterium]